MVMTVFMLHPESLSKIIEVAGPQTETLEYFQSAFEEKVNKSRSQAEYAGLSHEITKLVDNAVFQDQRLNKLDPWSGAAGLPDRLHDVYNTTEFSAFQEFVAAQSVSNVPVEQITMDWIISDEAEFKRLYSANGDVLEGESLDAMDTLFNAWLAQPENGMIMQDGIIYSGTEKGEVAKDKNASVVKERAEKVRELLGDEKRGFEQYLQQKKPDAKIVIIRHDEEREEAAPSSR